MRVLVVDDEAPARRRLIRMLDELEVQVVGEARDGLEALEAVDQHAPDLLFLDIRMPQLDGLALAAQYTALPPVIFVTAFDEHAVDAFEVGAVDYLLKPVRKARLQRAIERVQQRPRPAARSFEAMSEKTDSPKVIVHERGITRLFDARKVTRFWACQKYTLFLAEGEEHLTNEPLGALESRLGPFGFSRVHRAELIRLDAVRALEAQKVELADGQKARVSRRSIAALKKQLGL